MAFNSSPIMDLTGYRQRETTVPMASSADCDMTYSCSWEVPERHASDARALLADTRERCGFAAQGDGGNLLTKAETNGNKIINASAATEPPTNDRSATPTSTTP